jgi:hypothetical protein
MPTIDSDAHVVETEHTWDYMDPSDMKYRPQIYTAPDGVHYWVIDGKLRGRARGPVQAQGFAAGKVSRKTEVPEAHKYMEDIPGRLAHMDELDIDIQLLYPTIYIQPVCDRPETEVALAKSYNRWLADIWRQSKGRLRWACVLPFSVMEEALKELPWALEHGACGIWARGLEGDKLLSDPFYFPLYQEAARLNVPITCHIANSNYAWAEVFSKEAAGGTFGRFRLMSVASFHALITAGVPKMFPGLRFVFVEASSQWIPFVLHDLRRRLHTRGRELEPDVLKTYNIWVTCETHDDLPYVLKYAGPDNLLIGTDYGHQDQSSEIEAIRNMRTRGDLPSTVVDKMLWDNPKADYGL